MNPDISKLQQREPSSRGATPRPVPRQPFIQHLRSELIALLPATLSYSARLLIGFFVIALFSAFLVVYAAYENRLAYAELQQLEQQQRHYDVQWGQLLLERSTLASPSRIEKIARDSLQMQLIDSKDVRVVDPALPVGRDNPPSLLPAEGVPQ